MTPTRSRYWSVAATTFEIDHDHEHHGCGPERVRQHRWRWSLLEDRFRKGARHDRIPRVFPRRALSRVAFRGGLGELRERLPGLRVPHHDDPVALPVAAARRESGVFEDVVENRIGKRLAGEIPGGERGSHRLVSVPWLSRVGEPAARYRNRYDEWRCSVQVPGDRGSAHHPSARTSQGRRSDSDARRPWCLPTMENNGSIACRRRTMSVRFVLTEADRSRAPGSPSPRRLAVTEAPAAPRPSPPGSRRCWDAATP